MDNMMNHEMNPMVSPAAANMMHPMVSPAAANMMHPMVSPAMSNIMHPMVSPATANMMHPMVSPATANMMHPMVSPATANMMHPMVSPAMTNMMHPMVSPAAANMMSPMMESMKKGMEGSEEELMREIQRVGFAAVDLHLYLDTHPTDRYALMLFGQFSKHLRMLMDMYSRRYGAIEPGAETHRCPFSWVMSPWPWMRRDYMFDEEEY